VDAATLATGYPQRMDSVVLRQEISFNPQGNYQ
jgi:hypothetical protein